MSTEDTIRQAIEAYDRGDAEAVATLLHEDICYTINSNPALGPYHADCHCKAEFFAAVGAIQADWDINSYKLDDLIVSGTRGAAQIRLQITSRHTARRLQTRLALFMTVEGGKLTEIHEYHDTANVSTARQAPAGI